MKKFFEDQVSNPQAWPSLDGGYYIRFSIAREIFKRDEKEIKALAAQHKLKMTDGKGYISFTRN